MGLSTDIKRIRSSCNYVRRYFDSEFAPVALLSVLVGNLSDLRSARTLQQSKIRVQAEAVGKE